MPPSMLYLAVFVIDKHIFWQFEPHYLHSRVSKIFTECFSQPKSTSQQDDKIII